METLILAGPNKGGGGGGGGKFISLVCFL